MISPLNDKRNFDEQHLNLKNAALFIFNTDFQMRCAEMHLATMSEYTQ